MNKLFEWIDNSVDKINKFFTLLEWIILPLLRMVGYGFLAMYLMLTYNGIARGILELTNVESISILLMVYFWMFILMILSLRLLRRSLD